MTQHTNTASGAADLLDLIEAYAEARHRQGHSSYNAQTAVALQAVKAALAAGQATAAPAQPAAQQGAAYAALPEYGINTASHAHFRVIGFTADQMHAFADATHTLRASNGQAPAQPDPAYSEACNLATALFKKHFAHLPDFASGQAVWSLCDSTAGVISQIDNMVAGLARPPQPVAREPLADEQIQDLLLCGNPTDEEMRLIRIGWDAAHGSKGGQHVE